jgi:N-acetylglucosaminyldiphosphoundecaprenol N-acetyl-beta-D-mannosaminyltransferase
VDVLGVQIDPLDLNETVVRCAELIDQGAYVQQVSINTAKLVSLRRDPELREVVNHCGLVSADGQGIVLAARLLGQPLPGRVPGIDLMHALLSLAEQRGYRVFVLGAREGVLERAAGELRARHPGLLLSYRHGYFEDDEVEAVCAQVREARPDILFVAMSSPKKEYFLGQHGASLGASLVMGVGGSIDVVAGVTRRAPALFQRLGLEWLFRLAQEPRRLARRYLETNTRFALLLASEMARRALRRRS